MLIKDIEKMEAYTPTEYVNDSEPDLDADNLNKTERQLRDTVAKANEIIDTLKSLISNVSVNSEDTVPSSAVAYKMEQDIEQLNSNLSAVKNKFSNDLFYINSINQRVNDLSVGNASMISDITYMIKDKRIKTGCFGFANRTYSDVPVEVPKWGYVEYFQHADDYVTVRLYADYSTNIWIAQFVLGESKFKIDWVKK